MSLKINRRKFITNTSLSATGIILGSNFVSCSPRKKEVISSYDIMKDVMKYRKFDAHAHIWSDKDIDVQLRIADKLGIERIQISKPVTNYSGNEPEDPKTFRECNDLMISAMKQHPDRYIGFFTLNPVYQKESLEEIDRCHDQGLAGYKGYTQVKINDPLYYPIIERLIELRMVVFMHTNCQLGMAGYRMKYDTGRAPNTTIPEDMVDSAKKYPEAIFHFAHIGGGGDWEYMCKMLKECPNIYVDTSGSNNEENMIDFAIRYLGEDRLFFGTDGSYYQGVGKILASNATEEQKRKIFFDNYNNVLKKGGYHVA